MKIEKNKKQYRINSFVEKSTGTGNSNHRIEAVCYEDEIDEVTKDINDIASKLLAEN